MDFTSTPELIRPQRSSEIRRCCALFEEVGGTDEGRLKRKVAEKGWGRETGRRSG